MLRRAALAVVVVFVLLGAIGALGVRTASATVTSGTLTLSFEYAAVARPSLAVPVCIELERAGGFETPIELVVSTSYLEALDVNAISPEPESISVAGDADSTSWTFEPPAGDTFVVWLDSRIEPSVQWRRGVTVTAAADDDVVSLRATTWILP